MQRHVPMKPSTKPMRRYKRLGLGKKTKAKREAMGSAIEAYFQKFGWETDEGRAAYCQVSGAYMLKMQANAHHKTPRAELNKQAVYDLDAPKRLVIVHRLVHLGWIHSRQMGRPIGGDFEKIRFEAVEQSSANAENGERVKLSPELQLDLERFMSRVYI